MIADVKAYSDVRDSGIAWLGAVPVHWRLLPGRACYREKKVPNIGLVETTVLSLSYGQIVVKPPEKLHGLVPGSFETYQQVDQGDIVVRPTDLQNDWNSLRFGISPHRGIMTSAYLCFQTSDQLTGEYGHLLLHAYDLKKVFYGLGSGLRQNLDWKDFKYLPCLVPPLAEQGDIVRFLAHADRRVRLHIRAKQKSIKLLNEEKRAIIHRVLSRGLDRNVRLKPSHVGWLGEVPEHWEVLALRRRWTVTDCKHLTVPFAEKGFPFASVREVKGFDLNLTGAKRTTREWYEALTEGDRKPRRGDLVFCRNVSVGAAAFVASDEQFAMGQDVCLIRSKSQNQRFLNYVLHSPAMDEQLATLLVGSTFDRINVADVKNLILAAPPREEQDAITRYLDGALAGRERAILVARREINLLQEYGHRLIADVVTGQLDVRGAVSRMPDGPAAPESLEHASGAADHERESESAGSDAAIREVES